MLKPIHTTWMYYPERIIISLGIVAIINIICICFSRHKTNGKKQTIRNELIKIVLFNYCYALIFFTILGRRSLDYYRFNFQIGYSYELAFFCGDNEMLTEIIANIIVFIPIGVLASLCWKKKSIIKGLLTGTMISLCIEGFQLILKKGLCESDDFISNTVGTFIGCIVAVLYCAIKKYIRLKAKR